MNFENVMLSQLAAAIPNAIVGGPFGSNLVSADYVERGVPVIRGQNMGLGRWVDGEFVFVSEEKAKQLSQNTARPGDLVFTQRGTLGQVAVVPEGKYERYIVSQSQMKITVNSSKADVLFLYYLFNTPQQQNYIRNNAIRVGVPHTNLSILKKTPVSLPSLIQQREIASVLSALDDKIELNHGTNSTLQQMAQTLFKSWFGSFDPVRAKAEGRQPAGMDAEIAALFPNGFEEREMELIPRGWEICTIGDLVQAVGGTTPDTKQPKYWEQGVHYWATPKDLSGLSSPVLLKTERTITDEGLKRISSGLLPVGSVLMSSRAPIGYLAISEISVAINQGFIGMIPKPGVSNLFILLWAQANQQSIVERANGSTFLEISKSNFRPITLVRPTPDVMKAFDDLVRPLYQRIANNERETKKLIEIRDALLPKLISGQIIIPSATA